MQSWWYFQNVEHFLARCLTPSIKYQVYDYHLLIRKYWIIFFQVGSTMILTESPSLFESTIPIDALITKIGSVDAPSMQNSEW